MQRFPPMPTGSDERRRKSIAARSTRFAFVSPSRLHAVGWITVQVLVFCGWPAQGLAVQPSSPSVDASETDDTWQRPDAELERLLGRASEFAAEGRYDLAVVLWQRALDEARDTVMTREDWSDRSADHPYRKYLPLSEGIQRSLARLPAAGLRTYRLHFDGVAKALLEAAPGPGREQALADVVRRFFLSSHGDEAALELACRRLERYELVGASRLLTKLLRQYPDSNIRREQILWRLCVAYARMGAHQSAQATLAELQQMPLSSNARRLLPAVQNDVARWASTTGTVAGSNSSRRWHMRFGTPRRDGHMRGPALDANASPLAEHWTTQLDLKSLATTPSSFSPANRSFVDPRGRRRIIVQGGRVFIVNGGVISWSGSVRQPGSHTPTVTASHLIARWKSARWRPAGQLLLDEERVYCKNHRQLICCDAATGEVLWMGMGNQLALDSVAQFYADLQLFGANPVGSGELPSSLVEIALFGDRIGQSMSIAHNLLLNVEGKLHDGAATSRKARVVVPTLPDGPRRSRTNWLTAYDTHTGKLKWHRGAEEAPTNSSVQRGGFLAAPVRSDNLLLAPVTRDGKLWVYAMSAEDGSTIWQTALCNEPSDWCSPWSPVGITVDGGEAYVASGAGALFALDATSGALRWVVTYPRIRFTDPQTPHGGTFFGYRTQRNGFVDDVVIARRGQLIVMASDCDRLFCVDRRTGLLLWESDRRDAQSARRSRYLLGIWGDCLYVGGHDVVRQYDATNGRLVWETETDPSWGRGVVSDEGIFIPLHDAILRLDRTTGQKQQRLAIVSSDGQPVGNLYYGQGQWLVAGMGRVYALTDLQQRVDDLSARIARGDGQAQWQRMRLRARTGDLDGAVTDLREGYAVLVKEEGLASTNEALYQALEQLKLATTHPVDVLQLLAKSAAARHEQAHDVESGVNDRARLREREGEAPAEPLAQRELRPPKQRELRPPITALGQMAQHDRLRASILQTALSTVYVDKVKGAASSVLEVGPLCSDARLLSTACWAMRVTVIPSDVDILDEHQTSNDLPVREISTAGLAAVLPKVSVDELKRMLTHENQRIRIAAVIRLANQGDRAALPLLGGLLSASPLDIRSRSAQMLRGLTGQWFNYSAQAPRAVREAAAANWRTWIEDRGNDAPLTFPIKEPPSLLGRTLITRPRHGRVIEFDSQGNTVWQKDFAGAFGCHGMPNGHRLISSSSTGMTVQYDALGNEVWTAKIKGQPFSVRRLKNGNTLFACRDAEKVREIKPDRTIAWEVELPGGPVDARRLDNGHTLVCLMNGNRVVEIDRSGNVQWELSQVSLPRSAERLANGNTLVCETGNGRVIEVDGQGRTVWSKSGLVGPIDGQRLPYGNTLIFDERGIQELNPKGHVVSNRAEREIGRGVRY